VLLERPGQPTVSRGSMRLRAPTNSLVRACCEHING
jgi:hypothetical protein